MKISLLILYEEKQTVSKYSGIFSAENSLTDDVLASSHESNKERRLPRSLINPHCSYLFHT